MTVDLKGITEKISPVLAKNNVTFAGVFGSYARGEERDDSDVDILVEVRRPFGFLQFVRLKRQLEEILGRNVDLVTPNSLDAFIKPQAMRDLKVIYGEQR